MIDIEPLKNMTNTLNTLINQLSKQQKELKKDLTPEELEEVKRFEKRAKELAKKGDLITTSPYEIHTLKITEKGNTFIVFSEGKRGGSNYESDTFRVPSII